MATREGWHYFATRLNGDGTETIIATDLPLVGARVTSALSGPGGLTGTIPVEVARLKGVDFSIFVPWSTAVYAELGGLIRGGGIVTDVDVDDATVSITCQGFTSYAGGTPYVGEKDYVQADPFTIAREFWADLQKQRSNIGLQVVCSPSTTPVRLGQRPVDKWTTIDPDKYAADGVHAPLLPAGTLFRYTYTEVDSGGHSKKVTRYGVASRSQYFTNDLFPQMWWDAGAFTTSRGKLLFWSNGEFQESEVYPRSQSPFPAGLVDGVIRDASGNITFAIFGYITSTEPKADDGGEELQPWKINFFDTLDMGARWSDLVKDGSFEWVETAAWSGETIVHTLRCGYPTVGRDLRSSPEHRFEVGVNVQEVPSVSLDGDDYCDEVLVVGAGEGRAAARGSAKVPGSKRLHRVRVVNEPQLKTNAQANKRAAQLVSQYAGDQNVSTLKVVDHSFARLGSFGPGDVFELLGSGRGWTGGVVITLRIIGIEFDPDEGDVATLTVARPDKVAVNA